jgi:prophage maintenance system killer protein
MAFLEDLEDKIRAAYLKILEHKYPSQVHGKTLNCDSFLKVALEARNLINEAQSQGKTTVFEIADFIIFNLLRAEYFVYENHTMALFIGHLYLKNRGVRHQFSKGTINGNSTLEEISALTADWQKT